MGATGSANPRARATRERSAARPCFSPATLFEVDSEATQAAPAPPHPAWQRVLLARHPKRPHALDYIERILTDFQELHGDRSFADDAAIVAGMGRFEDRPVM